MEVAMKVNAAANLFYTPYMVYLLPRAEQMLLE